MWHPLRVPPFPSPSHPTRAAGAACARALQPQTPASARGRRVAPKLQPETRIAIS